MDPNQWRNFNLPYGQSPGISLGSGLGRLDMGHQQAAGFSSGFTLPQGLSISSHPSAQENPALSAFGLPKVSPQASFSEAPLLRSPIGEPIGCSIPSHYPPDALKSSQDAERGLLNLMNSSQLPLELTGPPPAHSGSTNQSLSRNPLAAENFIQHQPFSMKLQNQPEPLKISVPSSKVGYSEMRSPTSSLLYGLSSPGLEEHSQPQSLYGAFSSTQNSKPEQFSTTHSMNYDPVSPVSDHGQQSDEFTHVDFHDLSRVDHSRNSVKVNQNTVMMQHMNVSKSLAEDLGPDQNSYMSSHQFMHGSPSIPTNNGNPSPIHQSPHNLSPHVPSARESPQLQQPTSTIISSLSVHSIADSTSKSKKSKFHKRRSRDENHQNMDLVNSVNVSTSNPAYTVPGNYPSYSAPRNHTDSPQNLNSFSPQSYSPHMQQQHQQMQGSHPQNIQNGRHSNSSLGSNNSPVMNEYTSLSQTIIGTQSASSHTVSHSMESPLINHSMNTSMISQHTLHSGGMPSSMASGLTSSNSMRISSMQRPSVVEHQSTLNYNSGNSVKSTLSDPLGMQALGLVGDSEYQVSSAESSMYGNMDSYGNRFDVNGECLGYQVSQRRTSTIDEDALSSLIGGHPAPSHYPTTTLPPAQDQPTGSEGWNCSQDSMISPPKTVATKPEQDDEFAHLQKPPSSSVVSKETKHSNSLFQNHSLNSKPVPSLVQKPEIKKNPNSGFLNSFLSFIQGKKPETLSSVNTSVVKRPELPKYIPEPPRPKPVQKSERKFSSDSTSPKPDTYPSSLYSPSTSQASTFSEEEELGTANVSNKVQGIVQQIKEDGKPSLKMKISLGRGQSGQSVKHTVDHPKVTKRRNSKATKKKRRDDSDDAYVMSSGDEVDFDDFSSKSSFIEKPPSPSVPKRQLSSRKAKERAQQKKKYVESDSDDEVLGPIAPFSRKTPSDEEAYDSDRDPDWAPFEVETKKEPKAKAPRGRRRRNSNRASLEVENENTDLSKKKAKVFTPVDKTPAVPLAKPEPRPPESVFPLPVFRIGDFVMAKNDLNNFERFPIWRIDPGKMMKKYELFTDKGKILHMATCTYSSYLPKMDLEYIPIKVTTIKNERDGHVVEVCEADRPKPKLDSRLENEYEEDPLADMFNVYLQIFLSRALEPGFLTAILDSKEEFYLGPLNSIDDLIDKKLIEIDAKVQWKLKFKSALQSKPHIRELDRLNLKVACQACRFTNEPAIKSVHLFGQSYDHTTLAENKATVEDGSVEFLIGKTASTYAIPFHSLYHFKYNLSKRCQAKVDILRQGNSKLGNAEILDKCLNNRTWVLKIFDDLKNLLEKDNYIQQ
ncbi:uncharacterized protein LOC133175935 [Saccostrea echinata]|uniref:uncharacterized protein LOC133175935 n=1 Tax=Saccostrea echinata TaxID=191078 RepID=UPI002A80F687|nr:uncharacterized protein LOC133175935 [Saccostrea echinata]